MPTGTILVNSNNGSVFYASLAIQTTSSETFIVTETGLNTHGYNPTVTVDNGATYADNVLTLPFSIKGFATSGGASTPTYNIGDEILISVGSKDIYAVPSTSRVSVDVSTLAGWANLAAGSHDITIVAKASGFKDSAPSAAVQVTKSASMPAKGDIITLDSKQYRVLKTEGTVAEVLAMYDATTSQEFGSSQTYANSDIDTYCNTTFYNSLPSTMQNAIVAKTFQQDSWENDGGSSAIANYAGIINTSTNYTFSLMSTTFGSSITRKCYVLSCQDVIDYLEVTTAMTSANTTLTNKNIWKMFWANLKLIWKVQQQLIRTKCLLLS